MKLIATYTNPEMIKQTIIIEYKGSQKKHLSKKEKEQITQKIHQVVQSFKSQDTSSPTTLISKIKFNKKNEAQIYHGANLIKTLSIPPLHKPTSKPSIQLETPTSIASKGQLSKLDKPTLLQRALDLFFWCASILPFVSSPQSRRGRIRQIQMQALLGESLAIPYRERLPQLKGPLLSERIALLLKVYDPKKVGKLPKAMEQSQKDLQACKKVCAKREKLQKEMEEVRLMMSYNTKGTKTYKEYDKKLTALEAKLQTSFQEDWNHIRKLKPEESIVLPLSDHDKMTEALLRVTKDSNGQYRLQILDLSEQFCQPETVAGKSGMKRELAVSYKGLSEDELKSLLDLQTQKIDPFAEEWNKTLNNGIYSAKREIDTSRTNLFTEKTTHTPHKILSAYFRAFDQENSLKRTELKARLEVLSNFAQAVRPSLETNETNYQLLKDGVEKASRLLSKSIRENIIAPEEAETILEVLRYQQTILREADAVRCLRQQTLMTSSSSESFATTIEPAKDLQSISDMQESQSSLELKISAKTLSVPSLQGLSDPQRVTQTLGQCVDYIKQLNELKQPQAVFTKINEFLYLLEVPGDPDINDDFWSKIPPEKRAECAQHLETLGTFLHQSIYQQKLRRPLPPEVSISTQMTSIVLDRLARLDDPIYNKYYSAGLKDADEGFPWLLITNPSERQKANQIHEYVKRIHQKIEMNLPSFMQIDYCVRDELSNKYMYEINDFLEEKVNDIEKQGRSIPLTKLTDLTPAHHQIKPEQMQMARKLLEVACGRSEQKYLSQSLISLWHSQLIFHDFSDRALDNTYAPNSNAKTVPMNWKGDSPYLIIQQSERKRKPEMVEFRLTSGKNSDFHYCNSPDQTATDVNVYCPIDIKPLEGRWAIHSSERVIADQIKKMPERIPGLPTDVSRDRRMIDTTKNSAIEDALGFYSENRHLLVNHSYQEDLYRILFSSYHLDQAGRSRFIGMPDEDLPLFQNLQNPAFHPNIEKFILHQAQLFENEQNLSTASYLYFLGAQIQAHIAKNNPSIKIATNFEQKLEGMLGQISSEQLVEKKVITSLLANLYIDREPLQDKEMRLLCEAWVITQLLPGNPISDHPLRSHQVRRFIAKNLPIFQKKLQEDVTFRNSLMTKIVSETRNVKLESSSWEGNYPVFNNGDFTIHWELGLLLKSGKARSYLPFTARTDPHFSTQFSNDFNPYTEVKTVSLSNPPGEKAVSYSFERSGIPYRVIMKGNKETILQAELEVDGNKAWYQMYTESTNEDNIKGFGRVVSHQSFLRSKAMALGRKIKSLFVGRRDKTSTPIPPSVMKNKTLWSKTDTSKDMLVTEKDGTLLYKIDFGQSSAVKIHNLSKGKTKGHTLLNVWEKKESAWQQFSSFASSTNILVWGKNKKPQYVEFPEHHLGFAYNPQKKQWDCDHPELTGFRLSKTSALAGLGPLQNVLVVENDAGEKKVLVAQRKIIPSDPSKTFSNSFGSFFKAFMRPHTDFMGSSFAFDPQTPSKMFILDVDKEENAVSPFEKKETNTSAHIYLAHLFLRNKRFDLAMEQLNEISIQVKLGDEERNTIKALMEYTSSQEEKDPRTSAFMLHFFHKIEAIQRDFAKTNKSLIEKHYREYANHARHLPVFLLLPPTLDKAYLEKFPNVISPAFTGQRKALIEAKNKAKEPTFKAGPVTNQKLASKVHDVMHKQKLSKKEQALKTAAQGLSKTHKLTSQTKISHAEVSKMRQEMRSLPEDEYVVAIRDYMEFVLDHIHEEEPPSFIANLARLTEDQTSTLEMEALFKEVADCMQGLLEQGTECCKEGLTIPALDIAAQEVQESINSGNQAKTGITFNPFEPPDLQATVTLYSDQELATLFTAETRHDQVELEEIKGRLKQILERTSSHPGYENMSAHVAQAIEQDYDSFMDTYNQNKYGWNGDQKKNIETIEGRLTAEKMKHQTKLSSFADGIDEIIKKTSPHLGKRLEQQFKQMGTGVEAPDLKHLRHLLIQNKLGDLYALNPNLTTSDVERLQNLLIQHLLEETALQQIDRAQGILNAINMNPQQTEELLPLLIDQLSAKRCFNPFKHPEFLVMECEADVMLRPKQVSIIHEMVENPNCIKQLIMGAGKSKVILPLVALLKADGKNLSIVVTTQALHEVMKQQLLMDSKQLLQQDGIVFFWKRYSPEEAQKNCQGLYEHLNQAIINRQYLLSTRESFQCLEATYYELLQKHDTALGDEKRHIEETLKELKKVRLLLKEKGVVTGDEIDSIMNPKEKTIFPVGTGGKYEEAELDIAFEVFNQLILRDNIGLQANRQANLTPEERKAELREAASYFADPDRAQEILGVSPPIKNLIHANAEQFISYLLSEKEIPAVNNWIEKHGNATDKANLSILRGLFITLDKTTLTGTFGNDYIRSKDRVSTTPCEEKDKPKEGSQFGHRLENLCFTLQDYLQNSVDPQTLKDTFSSWHHAAIKQMEKEKISYDQTAAALTFQSIFGISLMSLKKNDQGQISDEEAKKLSAILAKNPDQLFKFLREQHLNKPTLQNKLIEQNSQQFVSMFKGFGGFSGTLNPYIFHRCNAPFMDKARDAGTDARTLFLLLSKDKKLQATGGIIVPYVPEGGADSKDTAADTPEKIKHLLSKAESYDVFSDGGGIIQGLPDSKVVDLMPHAEKNKKYFEESGKLMMKKPSGETAPLSNKHEAKDTSTTFLSKRFGRGADVPQHALAKQLTTTSPYMPLEDLLQNVWRLRGLDLAQTPFLLTPSWMNKHFQKKTTEAVTTDDVLSLNIKNKCEQEADNNFRKARDELEDIVRDEIRTRALETTDIEQEKAIVRKYGQFFYKEVKYDPYAEFGNSEKTEDPVLQLSRMRNDLKRLCSENEDELRQASANLEGVSLAVPFADHVRASSSGTEQTQVQTLMQEKTQLKELMQTYPDDLVLHRRFEYPSTLSLDDLESSYLESNITGGRENPHIKPELDYYFLSNLKDSILGEFLFSAQTKMHPAFSPELTFTANWCPIWQDKFDTEYKYKNITNDQGDKETRIVKRTDDKGNPIIAAPLIPFEHPLQQPVHFVRIKQNIDSTWEVRLLSKEDQDAEKTMLMNDRRKNDTARSQVTIGLWDIRNDTLHICNHDGFEKTIKASPKIGMLLVQAKVLGGKLDFSAEEKKYLDRWLEEYAAAEGKEGLQSLATYVQDKVLPNYPSVVSLAENTYFFQKIRQLSNEI